MLFSLKMQNKGNCSIIYQILKKENYMTTIERTTVIGVFEDRIMAERALDDLYRTGFSHDDIGFIIRSMTLDDADPETIQRETATGAATGAVSGGVVGGLLGAAAALLIPGLGPALAGGILAVTLGGVALGAVAGSFVGALTGFGIPEEDALYYQNELESGRIIVTVKAAGRYQEAFDILRHNGAYDANTRNNMQNVPLYDPDATTETYNPAAKAETYDPAATTETYDPDATIKTPALNSPRTYAPALTSESSTTPNAPYPLAARRYDRTSDADI
jgi:hypothetical protein